MIVVVLCVLLILYVVGLPSGGSRIYDIPEEPKTVSELEQQDMHSFSQASNA